MWTAVISNDVNSPIPPTRSKHSITLVGEKVYLLGGRNGHLPMRDFWECNLLTYKWSQIKPYGDTLPCLQEHSSVAYKDGIYVFGGEVSFSSGTETPLWHYNIKLNTWRKIKTKKGAATPKGRRGHTALLYKGNMLIYGGYRDLQGSSSELWAYHFETESWHLLFKCSHKFNNHGDHCPAARHKHSAIIHNDYMYIYGGMTDLHVRSDLWKFSLITKKWSCIKTKINPGQLHSHVACHLPKYMLIFGGETNGEATNDLWRFHFGQQTFERIRILGLKPQPCSETAAFALSDALLRANQTDNKKSVRIRPRTCFSAERCSSLRPASYTPINNKIGPSCEQTYTFESNCKNYVDGSSLAREYAENGKPAPRNYIQEKLSQLSIPGLNTKCSYTALSGSNTDSTESLVRMNSRISPQMNNLIMVKSKSAYTVKNPTECTTSFREYKNNIKNKKHVEFEVCDNNGLPSTPLPREPISVPNFSTFTLPTPVLTPVEASKLVYLTDDEDLNDFDTCGDNTNAKQLNNINNGGIKVNGVRRGESYSSHLGYADNPLYQQMINSTSSAVLEEEYISSTSDYASLETMNRLSSVSSYSVKTNTPQDDVKTRMCRNGSGGPFGFCNPNYLGPQNGTDNYKLKGKKLNTIHDSEVESNNKRTPGTDLEMQTFSCQQVHYNKHSSRAALPRLPLETNGHQQFRKINKYRASSEGRAEHQKPDQIDCIEQPQNHEYMSVYMYVIGGKEQGQLTVFGRPISMWKLKIY